jgi:hypothetical protein
MKTFYPIVPYKLVIAKHFSLILSPLTPLSRGVFFKFFFLSINQVVMEKALEKELIPIKIIF